MSNIHGIIGYTITPFGANGEGLDLPALGQSIDRLIDSGVHAIAPLGSTGEGAYLSDAEWDQVAEFSIKHVAKRVPTIVSVSDLTTAKAVRRARFAEAHGADVVMVLPASYWKLSEAEILAHYRAIGDSIGLPIMLYNNPATSGTDMSVELILRIVNGVENVTMVKRAPATFSACTSCNCWATVRCRSTTAAIRWHWKPLPPGRRAGAPPRRT
jgi:4-hydroxy-tetrahydrodipicolinate synthase